MKQTSDIDTSSVYRPEAIPCKRTKPAMPSAVREFADLLAQVALQKLRSIPDIAEGATK